MSDRTLTLRQRAALALFAFAAFFVPRVDAAVPTMCDDGLGVATGFNALVFESFTARSSDVGGRIAAGGDLYLRGYSVGTQLQPATAGNSVVVGGDFTFPDGRIYNGSVLVAGSAAGVSSSVRAGMGPGQTIVDHAALPFDFADVREDAILRSQAIAALPANGSYKAQWGGLYLTGAPGGALQVFDLPGDLILRSHTFDVTGIPAGATIVFNIRGKTAGFSNVSLAQLVPHRQRVLYNFPEATTLKLVGMSMEGSILAPFAHVQKPQGTIFGTLIAKSWDGEMPLFNTGFSGCGLPGGKKNAPPEIVSPPVTVVREDLAYRYDVEAIDPDDDPLTHALRRAPAGAAIDAASGLVTWTPDRLTTQSVRVTNSQCYVVPDGAGRGPNDNTTTPPLYQRVREAITRGSDYAAPQTVSWHRTNACLGCHVQTQTLLGLEASKDRAPVDEAAAEYLLGEILASQLADGAIRRSHPEYAKNQTAFALWALSYVPDRARTLAVRGRALDFFLGKVQSSGEQRYFTNDHPSGWLGDRISMTALVALGGNRFIADVMDDPAADPAMLATAMNVRALMPGMALHLLAQPANGSSNLGDALLMVGLAELRGNLADASLRASVEARITEIDQRLRARQRADGGWGRNAGNASDPLTSAWVGFALDALDPPLTDPVVEANIEYLLSTQKPNGTWQTTSGLFETHLATTGLVMAYLPVALEHLGNPDLAVGHLVLDAGTTGLALRAEIFNRGLAPAPGLHEVEFRSGDPVHGTLLGTATLDGLARGETRWVSIPLAAVPVDDVVHALVVPSALSEECDVTNNASAARLVEVRATDPRGLFDTQHYLLNVEDANEAPVVISAPVTVLEQSKPYVHQVKVHDADIGDAHRFELVVAPAGLYLDEHSGRFAYDVAKLAVGVHQVTLRAVDLRGASGEQSFELTVHANQPPLITSSAPLDATVGEEYAYAATATDADGDALEWKLIASPLTMTIDAPSGRISWVPEARHIGNQPVTLAVSDGRGGEARQSFNITVAAAPPANTAPVITSTPVTEVTARDVYVYAVVATDADGDSLAYALTVAPAGASIDAAGRIEWTSADADIGTHDFTVSVSDGRGGAASQSFVVTVLPFVAANQPPVIISTPRMTEVRAGKTFQYVAIARDPDGDPIRFSLVHGPDRAVMEPDGNLVWEPREDEVGEHRFSIAASDGRGGIATQDFTLLVLPPIPQNRSPIITSMPPRDVVAGDLYSYQIVATDEDGDALSYLLGGPNAPATAAIDGDGLLTWPTTAADVGVYDLEVRVTDGRGGEALQEFSVEVHVPSPGNRAPVITSAPPDVAKAGVDYAYAASADDADGDALTWRLAEAPAGMTIDPASGALHWLPQAAGSFAVRIEVSDGAASASQAWTIAVAEADRPLSASLDAPSTALDPGAGFDVRLDVAGGRGAISVNASLGGVAVTLTPNAVSRLVAPTASGSHVLAATVSDGTETVEVTHAILVRDASDTTPPVVKILAPQPAADADLHRLTAQTQVTGTVTDANLADWRLMLVERGAAAGEAIELAHGTTPVNGGELGGIDPTLLRNGQYTLLLEGRDHGGNTARDQVALVVEGDMKLGHFRIGFEDLTVPLSGIPITLTRTYDTRTRHRKLDFGYGWELGYSSVRLQETRTPGYGWESKRYAGRFGIPRYCTESALGNVVSVTLPDERVEKFKVKATPECNEALPLLDVSLVFEAMPGTRGKLKSRQEIGGRLVNGSIVDLGSFDVADPDQYLYIDENGREFSIDQGFGVREIRERRENAADDITVTFERDGIVHSNGTRVDYLRDPAGRITQVLAPDGRSLGYAYDIDGNLAAFTDAAGNTTTFGYLAGHYLEDIHDPNGVRVSRNEYDDKGRLVAVIDANGNRIEYANDIAGRTAQVKDRAGNTTTYVYNDRGDVIAETNAEGETTYRSYDEFGNRLSETDALGNTERWTYDGLGNITSHTNAAGEKTTSTYGSFNHLISQTDGAGNRVFHNEFRNISLPGTGVEMYPGPLVASTDANGVTTRFGYNNATGDLAQMTDGTGAVTRFEYDAKGFKTADVDALGNRIEYLNDAMGRPLEDRRTRTRADGSVETLVTRYTYDGNGNLTRTENPDGSVTTSTYDGNDRVTRACDALNRCVTTDYDALGNVIKTTFADGTSEHKAWDANGNLITETDRLGRVTQHVYDRANRRIATIHPDDTPADPADNPVTQSIYDRAGRLLQSIDELGRVTAFGYDGSGRRTREYAPDPVTGEAGTVAITVTTYDAAGRRASVTDALGNRTQYTYDAGGRLTATTHADGSQSRVEYDASGRKIADIDEMGRRTTYRHDALGRLVEVTLAAGTAAEAVTTYAYDEVGNKIRQTDAEGRVTHFEYDAMGRETARMLPMGQRETRRYNAAGELIEHTDFNGATTRHEYDAAGRITRIDYPNDADASFSYDAAGQRVREVVGQAVTESRFDARGRLVERVDGAGHRIAYGYDAAGNLTTRVADDLTQLTDYDARNRPVSMLSQATGGAPETTTWAYDAIGNRSREAAADGTVSEYAHDARHRLANLVKRTAAGVLLASMSYQVDASGMRTSVHEADAQGAVRSATWHYDGARRLTGETITHRDGASGRSTSWEYDKVGNRLSQSVTGPNGTSVTSYRFDANDRLISETSDGQTTSYTHDANGSTLTKAAPGGTTSYAWNDAARLKLAQTPGVAVSYAYDAHGLRVGATETRGGQGTHVWYQQDTAFTYAKVIAEYRGATSTTRSLDAVFNHADEPLSQTRQGSTRYLQQDGFGSTRWLTDPHGNLTDTIDYDAFGNEIGRSGTTEVEHLYRGEAFDPTTGFYYLRARWMDPSVGRFTKMDNWRGKSCSPNTLNKYIYADADPVNGLDPSGMMTIGELGAAINLQVRTNLSSAQAYRVVFQKTGCLLIEAMVEQTISNAVYVFIDGVTGLPYVGKTKNDVDLRLKQHANQGARTVKNIIAKIHVSGGKGELQVIEQLIYDLIKPETDLSNRIRPLSETRPNKSELRKLLSKIKLCK